MTAGKWPKVFPPLTLEQEEIRDDFVKHWHEVLAGSKRYSIIEKFDHGYALKHRPADFKTTLEIGAGLGEHLGHETLTPEQRKNYVALELRENMAEQIRAKFPDVQTLVADCQKQLPFPDNHFDRILAIHVLEHLPDLPAAIKEMYRLCHKQSGQFSIVIPCEGGLLYQCARKISAERIFRKRYRQSYQWFIEREHVNRPDEIINELANYFIIETRSFFPFFIPVTNLNLCIGLTLRPKRNIGDVVD